MFYVLNRPEFIWHCWEGCAIVYDTISGNTHRISAPAALILEAIEREQCDSKLSLLAEVQQTAGHAVDQEKLNSVTDALLSLGLITDIPLEDSRPRSD